MKTVILEQSTLDACVKDARDQQVVVTKRGKPVALVVGLDGMDTEQAELGSSDKFWRLISDRRAQKTVSRQKLEKSISKKMSRKAI
jgi:antitoxin (DNA-binding transcriptional repressor) of toxin-antitoxin stability system